MREPRTSLPLRNTEFKSITTSLVPPSPPGRGKTMPPTTLEDSRDWIYLTAFRPTKKNRRRVVSSPKRERKSPVRQAFKTTSFRQSSIPNQNSDRAHDNSNYDFDSRVCVLSRSRSLDSFRFRLSIFGPDSSRTSRSAGVRFVSDSSTTSVPGSVIVQLRATTPSATVAHGIFGCRFNVTAFGGRSPPLVCCAVVSHFCGAATWDW